MLDIDFPSVENADELLKWLALISVSAIVQYLFTVNLNRKLESIRAGLALQNINHQIYTAEKVKKYYEVLEIVYNSVIRLDSALAMIVNSGSSEALSKAAENLEEIKVVILPKVIFLDDAVEEKIMEMIHLVFGIIISKQMIFDAGSYSHDEEHIKWKASVRKEIYESTAKSRELRLFIKSKFRSDFLKVTNYK